MNTKRNKGKKDNKEENNTILDLIRGKYKNLKNEESGKEEIKSVD